jgi:hypothetical protein
MSNLAYFLAGVEPSPLLLRPFIGLLYYRWMMDADDCGAISGMNQLLGKPYSEETCPSAALSRSNPTFDLPRSRTRAVEVGN